MARTTWNPLSQADADSIEILPPGSTYGGVGPVGPPGPASSVNGTTGAIPVFTSAFVVGNSAFLSEDATKVINTGGLSVAGDLSGTRGDLPSTVRTGAGAIGGIYFNGVSGSNASGSLTGQTPGTGSFSFGVKFRMPSSAFAASFVGLACIGSSVSVAGASSAQIWCSTTNDTIFLEFDGSSGSNYRRFALPASTRTTAA